MTIRECVDGWVTMDDELRSQLGNTLFDMLTPVSAKELTVFQLHWPSIKAAKYRGRFKSMHEELEAFLKEQQEKLRMCVELEAGNVGIMVREALGLQPIQWTDHILEDAEVINVSRSGTRGLEAPAQAEATIG